MTAIDRREFARRGAVFGGALRRLLPSPTDGGAIMVT